MDRQYQVELVEPAGAPATLGLVAPDNPLPVPAGKSATAPFFVIAPRAAFDEGRREVRLRVDDGAGWSTVMPYRLLGPADDEDHEHKRKDKSGTRPSVAARAGTGRSRSWACWSPSGGQRRVHDRGQPRRVVRGRARLLRKAVDWDRTMAQEARNVELGWQVSTQLEPIDGGRARLVARVRRPGRARR